MEAITLTFEHTKRVLEEMGAVLVERYKDTLKSSTGKLSEVKAYLRQNNMKFEVVLDLQDYWRWVEYGRDPYPKQKEHWPPIAPIREWVRIHPELPNGSINPELPSEVQLEQKAYMYRASIGKKGFQGKHGLETSSLDIWDNYKQLLSEALLQDLNGKLVYAMSVLPS